MTHFPNHFIPGKQFWKRPKGKLAYKVVGKQQMHFKGVDRLFLSDKCNVSLENKHK